MKWILMMGLLGAGAVGTAYVITQQDEPENEIVDEIEDVVGGPIVGILNGQSAYITNDVTFEVTDADKYCVNDENTSVTCTWDDITFDDGTTDNVTITLEDGTNYVYFKDDEENISDAIEITVDRDVTLITINPYGFGTVANTDPAIDFTLYFSIYDHGDIISVTNGMLSWEAGTDLNVEGEYDLLITYVDSKGITNSASLTFTISDDYQG